MPPARTRLLLVGAGHAHLEVLRRMAHERPAELDMTIVSLGERHFYSGMIPGYLAGQYALDDVSFDIPAMARRAGAACLIGCAAGLDPAARIATLEDGREVPYDLVSLSIGSLEAGADHPAVAEAVRIKPLHRVGRLKRRLESVAAGTGPAPARIAVIGAGAGGVELAFAAAALMDRAGRAREITLVERAEQILGGYGARYQRLARRALERRDIRVRAGAGVSEVQPDRVELDGGGWLASDLSLWLTGPRGAPLLASSGLPMDSRGFLWTEDTLQSVADPRVFAAGDCGTLRHHPGSAKSGVHAVRQGPVLWHNLLAAARGRPPMPYRPQRSFLSILNTADGRALLHYRGLGSWSRWAWHLKDRIDRGFMGRYRG